MTNHKITSKQIRCTFIMFWAGSLVVIGYNPESKQDSWITMILAGIMVIPLFLLLCRIVTLYPGKNLYEIILEIFGDTFGKILTFLYVVYSIHLGSMITKTFTSFIHTLNMPETPEQAVLIFIVLVCFWSVKSGPENIARIAKYTFSILTFTIILLFVIAIKDMHIDNMKPIMNTDFSLLLSSAFTSAMLPLGEVVICLSLFSALDSETFAVKIFMKSLAITVGLLVLILVRNILVLGAPTSSMYYYPSYQTASIISVGEFFTRIEVLVGVNNMLAGFTKISVCLYSASLGLAKLLNVENQKPFVAPCSLIIATLSELLYKSTVEIFDFIQVYRIYAIPFEIIIPLIIWLGAELQTKIKAAKLSGSQSIQQNQGSAQNPSQTNQNSAQNANQNNGQENTNASQSTNQTNQTPSQNTGQGNEGSGQNNTQGSPTQSQNQMKQGTNQNNVQGNTGSAQSRTNPDTSQSNNKKDGNSAKNKSQSHHGFLHGKSSKQKSPASE